MKLPVPIIISMILLLSAVSWNSYGQTKAISTLWSLNGIGLGYEHILEEDSFIQADLRAEMAEVFMNRKGRAGITASFTWNMIFAGIESGNGNTVSFFAGPGAVIGIADDYKSDSGGVFGFKGRIGAECTYDRHVSLSFCFAPVIGMHLSRRNETVNMRMYRNGLIYGILPEIGIKYAF